jgi:hypothetical protein
MEKGTVNVCTQQKIIKYSYHLSKLSHLGNIFERLERAMECTQVVTHAHHLNLPPRGFLSYLRPSGDYKVSKGILFKKYLSQTIRSLAIFYQFILVWEVGRVTNSSTTNVQLNVCVLCHRPELSPQGSCWIVHSTLEKNWLIQVVCRM